MKSKKVPNPARAVYIVGILQTIFYVISLWLLAMYMQK